ncbi:Cold shock protein CapB [Legionella quinlivanii]|uniref:Cold shock protein CapB n=2 Tax=Legionella quinlivanii TaxID=45073 RepID=A0A0W0XZK5_9GAMM|nr:Cold shock protein CapB [Legionella quinlivanii]SEF95477.1 cold-shock DNA-binding protein family [Legionella quinlivanii DSM 21216]STY11235.1 cold shock protein; Qin prophage [Legionella quinlivanii]
MSIIEIDRYDRKGIVMSQRESGTVKWFNEKKGFGFIVNQNGDDIFVHYKDIQGAGFKTLHENDSVTFVLDKGPKGLKAQDVMVTSE